MINDHHGNGQSVHPSPAEPTPSASPAPTRPTTLDERLVGKSVSLRTLALQRALASPHERIRVPNRVSFRTDPESMMDAAFVDDLLHEAQGRPGVFVQTSVQGTFEFCPEELIADETDPAAAMLLEVVRSADAEKQALTLFQSPILVTEEHDGKKSRKPYRLVRLNLSRSSVQRVGIEFDPAAQGTRLEEAQP